MNKKFYDEWIAYIFNRDESRGDWRFNSEDNEYEDFTFLNPMNEELEIEFITRIFENYKSDLDGFSDWQLGMGIDYIFNSTCSNMCFPILDGKIPIDKKLRALQSIKNLYEHCFTPRCPQELGHLAQTSQNPLNNICYMLWDIAAIGGYCENDPNKEIIESAHLDLLNFSLHQKNIACIESGLHGLGHMVFDSPESKNIIENFIKENPNLDDRVLAYAQQAKTGMIQ